MHTPNPPVEKDSFTYSQGKINLQYPDGRIERLIVAGPTKVEVGLDDSTGFAADTDGNGLDDVPTTMTLLNLFGYSTMGTEHVNVMPDPVTRAKGKSEEEVNTMTA